MLLALCMLHCVMQTCLSSIHLIMLLILLFYEFIILWIIIWINYSTINTILCLIELYEVEQLFR